MVLSSLIRRKLRRKRCACPARGAGGRAGGEGGGAKLAVAGCTPGSRFLLAAAGGGVAAAVVSTLVQIALWLLLTEAFPAVLWRDARLTAAIVLGEDVLPPPADFDWLVMVLATVVHFALSLVYGAVFHALTCRLRRGSALAAGAVLGLMLYLVNLYGFTLIFPWFAVARDGITLVAHLAFGVSAVAASRLVLRRLAAC